MGLEEKQMRPVLQAGLVASCQLPPPPPDSSLLPDAATMNAAAQDPFKASDHFLLRVIETAPYLVYIYDIDEFFLFVNNRPSSLLPARRHRCNA
jgi:hypothetical protein